MATRPESERAEGRLMSPSVPRIASRTPLAHTDGQPVRERSISARDISPIIAIEAGYNLYLAEQSAPDSVIQQSAQVAVNNFHLLLEQFDPVSPEGIYCLQLRMASNSLARGIERRKRMQNDMHRAAVEEKDTAIRKFAQTESWFGILKGAIQILSLGGFGYALVHAIFEIPKLTEHTQGMREDFAAATTALGIALIGSFFKAKFITRRLFKAFDKYDQAKHRANNEYSQTVRSEYLFAAETANNAWQNYTGEPSPLPVEIHNLMLRNMGAGEEEIISQS